MDSTAPPAVVIDLGSGFIKAGLQSDTLPTCILPSLIGRPRRRFTYQFQENQTFAGDEAVAYRHQLSFSNPINHGHIEDWIELEELLGYTFRVGLGIDTKDRPILLSAPPLASTTHQQRLVESMIEIHEFNEVNLSIQGILALYATGRTTGLVVEIGEGVTQVVPVHEGYADKASVRRSDFGGYEITCYLQKLLCENGYALTTRDDMEHVRLIKESLCYVALDPLQEDSRTDLEETYVLPDGMKLRDGNTSIVVGPERFYCAEVIFEPRICQRDNPPITDLIWQAVQSSPIETRKSQLNSVILSGGTSMLQGFQERLQKELKKIAPSQARGSVNVYANDDRLFGVWLGGRLFCQPSMRTMQNNLWITKDEWLEEGPNVVLRKNPFASQA